MTTAQIPFIGTGSTVKAWCLTARTVAATNTQTDFDDANFIDGYNLRLDVHSQTYLVTSGVGTNAYDGAVRFSFIEPMPDTRYKVFLQHYNWSDDPLYAHVLNSATHPKTTNSFWVRCGIIRGAGATPDQNNEVLGWRFGVRVSQLGVIVI